MATDIPGQGMPMLMTESRVAFIDDDVDYLSTFRFLLPASFRATFHPTPETLHPVLVRSKELLAREQRRLLDLVLVQTEQYVGGVATAAIEFFADPARHEMTVVLVSDFSMPAEDGVSICARFAAPGLQRILLTGIADHAVAVSAFNAGSIDMYLPKHTPQLGDRVVSEVHAHRRASAAKRGELLASALPPRLNLVLQRPSTAAAVRDLLRQHQIAEYLVIGKPHGILGVTSDGEAKWVQLEDSESRMELAEVAGNAGFAAEVLARIRGGQTLVDVDFATDLRCAPAREEPAVLLCAHTGLSASVFPITGLPDHLRPSIAPAVR